MAQQPIKVTVTSSIHRQTTEAMKLYDSNTQRHLDRVANELRNQVLRGMKTTKKQSVGYSRGKGKKLHYPSVVGSPPAIDTGRLINSIHSKSYAIPNRRRTFCVSFYECLVCHKFRARKYGREKTIYGRRITSL